jgi:outer membrane protein with beta-barrel domain
MSRKAVVLIMTIAMSLVGAAARAQETGLVGAGKVELAVIPIGGVVFMEPGSATTPSAGTTPVAGVNMPKFNNYVIGATATANVNPWVGIEGDVNFAVGRRQDLTFSNLTLTNQKTPNLWNYNASAIVNVTRSDRRLVPYVAGGVGAITMLNTTDAAALGVSANQTYFTENVGAGLRWFPIEHWGIRGDYRHFFINSNSNGPAFFAQNTNRHANRVYGSLILTF